MWGKILCSGGCHIGDDGCFPLCQRFRKFRLEFKWKGPFRFLLTLIFGTTSGGGPLISVGIFRPKFVVPVLTNWFFALIREFGREKQTVARAIPIGWPGLIGKCPSILLRNSHWPLTGRFGIMESTQYQLSKCTCFIKFICKLCWFQNTYKNIREMLARNSC